MERFDSSGNGTPKYLRLAQYFRKQVQSGALKPGDKLPSYAWLQSEYGIGQATLERVYDLLEQERIIVREPKRGTFVAEQSQDLARGGVGVVGVMLGQPPSQSPYYRDIVDGLYEVAFEEKMDLLLLHDTSKAAFEKMDGIITIYRGTHLPPTMPCVDLMRTMESNVCVTCDDYGGAEQAVWHLVNLGHRRIGYMVLGGHSTKIMEGISRQRVEGYKNALIDAHIEPARAWVRPLRDPWEDPQPFADMGYAKMRAWLEDDFEKTGCTAIIAHNDDTAIGIYRALEEAGLRVPEDISVVGFDATDITNHMRPRLTSVAVPLREIGALGMRMLLKIMRQDPEMVMLAEGERIRRILPTKLKIGESTAPPR